MPPAEILPTHHSAPSRPAMLPPQYRFDIPSPLPPAILIYFQLDPATTYLPTAQPGASSFPTSTPAEPAPLIQGNPAPPQAARTLNTVQSRLLSPQSPRPVERVVSDPAQSPCRSRIATCS